MDCHSQLLRNQDIQQISGRGQCSRSRSRLWSRKSFGRVTADWRVLPAGGEAYRKDILNDRIGAPDMVDYLGEAPIKVDCVGEATGNALPSFSSRISLTVVISP
jgi:hypothetical protein